ncbi:hypothetical protein M413DRAFT_351212 [Hebeloma cylindrosporum]|uniref:Ankyrin n=1 Tax=Hebeloma cylindrosporum TaxID=76867 RepID=A0A0C2XBE2_HEBCY|nr:hypothetical protein M413DRAFT_351212 [Hebeloma cylindrosporum h7]
MMDSSTTSIDNLGLHHYAIVGDDEGVRRSLREGADVNALDTAGRTAVMCAVAGENWQSVDGCDASFMTPTRLNALKTLLGHPDISLLTLNAPQSSMNGVIPLGMAAWLNQPQAVRTLLDDSADSVFVDGMDSHGATALMYAARDGSLEVVQALLSHGARPDFRDRNHRTSIQFALAHSQILWLCETILRRHRLRESRSADRTRLSPENEYLVELACSSMPFSDDLEPPPTSIFTQEALSRLTNTLISSIRNSDVAFLHSLLFSPSVQPSSPAALYPMSVPVLINLLDSNGWSLVHHCVSAPQPSIEILDALYCAGAEVSLFTTHEQQTPLHFLARSQQPDSTHSLHDFVLHLIQDLRAPLSARDKDEETCIHIAAEHGHSIDLLMLFLHCDTSGTIRAMKNSRGLTALEVAKTEFLPAFGIETRSNSALSNYTMRPTDSFTSLSSLSDLHSFYRGTSSDALSIFSASDFDVDGAVQQLLSILRATSPSGYHTHKLAHIQYLEHSIEDISLHADSIIVHFRSRIEEATRVITDLQKNADRIDSVQNVVALATQSKLTVRGIAPLQSKRRHRDSEDSQMTFAVSDDDASDRALFLSSASTRVDSCSSSNIDGDQYCSVGTQTALLDFYVAHNTLSRTDAVWMERFIQSPDSPVCRAHLANLWDVECELTQLERQAMTPPPPRSASASPTKVAMKLKQVLRKKKRLEEKIQDLEFDHMHLEKRGTTSRFKAWIKRMVVPHQQLHSSPPKLELVLDLESAESGNVGRELKRSVVKTPSTTNCGDAIDRSIDRALRTSKVVLEAAHRDLMNIKECLSAAEQFIDLANHSISRTQRVVKRAIKKREAMLTELEQKAAASSKPLPTIDESDLSPCLLGYSNAMSSRPSLASISTIYSTASSIASVAATLTENDDEDIRILRRLLLRKIEAQTSGAWDEVDKVTGWIQIVKEAVRSVKRRAYL